MNETHEPGTYTIRIKGHLSQQWSARFAGMTITHMDDGTTHLVGPIADQAALHGLLRTVRDSGLELMAVNRTSPNQNDVQEGDTLMPATMNAIVYTQYGPPDVLRLQTVPVPTPAPNEVLIKVHAASVTTGDVNIRGFTFVPSSMKLLPRLVFGLRKPKKPVLGTEVAGDVVAVGADVTRFQVGDRVFGIGSSELGAHAEYVTRTASGALALIPAGVSYEDAVSLPFGAGTAYYFLKARADVGPGQHVLVNGASGGVGIYAVQIAKAFGAEVTAVCSSRNADLVREMGADHIIDYSREDFTRNHGAYDLIVDTVVGQMTFDRAKAALKPQGRYLAVAGGLGEMLRSAWNKRLITGSPKEDSVGIEQLAALLQAGQIKPVIDRRYPLAETVDAHRYVETRRKRGSVVISVTGA